MKLHINALSLFLPLTLLFGCCYSFSDMTPGNKYNVGQVISTSEFDIQLKEFQWENNNWTSSGYAEVDTRNYAQGSGNDLHSNNVNMQFLFEYPLKKISFKFGELGGNCNVKVNDDFRNVEDLFSLNNTSIGGIPIKINATLQGFNWYGEMVLEGTINSFTIGGQELWIDEICTEK
jgi:hypothetical protein